MRGGGGVWWGMYRRWLRFQPDYEGAVLMEVINLERGASFRTAICEFGLRIILNFLFHGKKTKNNQYLEPNILHYGHHFGP